MKISTESRVILVLIIALTAIVWSSASAPGLWGQPVCCATDRASTP